MVALGAGVAIVVVVLGIMAVASDPGEREMELRRCEVDVYAQFSPAVRLQYGSGDLFKARMREMVASKCGGVPERR